METNLPVGVTQNQIERMSAAIERDATGESGTATEKPPLTLETLPRAPAPAPARAAAPAKSADDLGLGPQPTEAELDAMEAELGGAPTGSGDAREVELAQLREQVKNLSGQVSGSHQRNRESAEREQRILQAEARAMQAYQQTVLMQNGLSAVARALPPEQFQQLMATIQQDGNRGVQGDLAARGVNPPNLQAEADMTEIGQLRNQVAQLTQNVHGFAYGVNSSAIRSEIYAQLGAVPLMRVAEKAGYLDRIVDGVITKLSDQERSNPGTVNPLDARALRVAVKSHIDAAVKEEKRVRDAHVLDWIASRRALNKKAPAPVSGPGGSARSIQPGPSAKTPANMPQAERMDHWTQQMIAAGRGPSSGIAAEIG